MDALAGMRVWFKALTRPVEDEGGNESCLPLDWRTGERSTCNRFIKQLFGSWSSSYIGYRSFALERGYLPLSPNSTQIK